MNQVFVLMKKNVKKNNFMKENFFEEKQQFFRIETIKGPREGEASYCPERGGIINSLKLEGKEVLYLDEETFKDIYTNVKGGIPILFPNAGPLDENCIYPKLEQHGFARKLKWQKESINDGFKEMLEANEETRKIFPYNFRLSQVGKFENDGSFTFSQEIENNEENKELPISMGLHPYFKVPYNEKNNIKFNFEGGKEIEEKVEIWSNGKAISIDNPKIKDNGATLEVTIPNLGKLLIDVSEEYKKIWIWSMTNKDFICIEPVMRDKNGLIENPEKVQPKAIIKSKVNFKLIK